MDKVKLDLEVVVGCTCSIDNELLAPPICSQHVVCRQDQRNIHLQRTPSLF